MFITKEDVLVIHGIILEMHGGSAGIRDMIGLESALARPFQTFDGEDLYTTVFEKAAALGESIIMNHPFIDGNKRTGYILMETTLRIGGFKIIASDDLLYDFIISISTGENKFEQIVEWLKQNTKTVINNE